MRALLALALFLALFKAHALSGFELNSYKIAYPKFIRCVSGNYLVWQDGTRMLADDGKANKTEQEQLESPSLLDQVHSAYYTKGKPSAPFNPEQDPGRVRYLPFFKKMYGATEAEVQAQLVTLYWMPHYFASAYPLEVTRVNHVHRKLMHISQELEALVNAHPEYLIYLYEPGGTFKWRLIANTKRLSTHSFGMTVDINAGLSNYWLWDLIAQGKNPTEEEPPLPYRNSIPWPIVRIFERHGFIWGGKWRHYDTMHFEYRPELLI